MTDQKGWGAPDYTADEAEVTGGEAIALPVRPTICHNVGNTRPALPGWGAEARAAIASTGAEPPVASHNLAPSFVVCKQSSIADAGPSGHASVISHPSAGVPSAHDAPAAMPMHGPLDCGHSSQALPPAVAAAPERAAGGGFLGGRKTSRHPERDAEVARLWGQTDPHLTTAQIGVCVGMSETAVSAVARRMGLPLRNRVPPPRTFTMPTERVAEFCRRYDAGEDRSVLALDFGISRSFLPRLARRLGLAVESAPPITEADNERLRALLEGGATLNEAAATMGKARTTIGRMCKTLGITSSEDARFAKRRAGAQARWDAQQARAQARIEARQARPQKPGRQTNDGLEPRLRELVEGGHTISGAARIMGMPVGSMIKLARRHGIVPTAAAMREAIRNRPLAGAVVAYARKPKPARDAALDPAPEPAPPVRFAPWTPGENDDGCSFVLQTRPVAYCGAPRRDRRCSYCATHAAQVLRAVAA